MTRSLVAIATALSIAVWGAAPSAADTLLPVAGTSLLVGVACPTADSCVATGQAGSQQLGVVVATNDKQGGVQGRSGTNELYGVGCASDTRCFAVGTGGMASNGQLVSVTGGLAGPPVTIGQTEYLRGIACPTSTFCVAVGWAAYNGPPFAGRIAVVVPIVNGTAQAVETVSGTPGLEAIACPTSTTCLAVGDENSANGGAALVPITNGTAGGVTTVSAASQLNAITCVSPSSCLAVGSGAGTVSTPVVVPITDGTADGAEPVPGDMQGTLAGVACDTPYLCWAAGWAPTGIIVPIEDGTVGSAIFKPGAFQLYGVACPTGGTCVAVGDSAPGGGTGVVLSIGGVAGPWKARDKAAAASDLPDAALNAVRYCTPTALGFTGFGVGTLMIGSAGVLAVAGLLTTYATEPFCLATVKRVLTDYHRLVADPPVPNLTQLANPVKPPPVSMPSCSRWQGALRTFCDQLRPAEQQWAGAANKVASIDEALDATRTREAEALAADDQAAANLQDAHIPSLEHKESSAVSAELSAGRAVAQVLTSHHIGYRITTAESSAIIADVERALAKDGISASELETLDGAALKPRGTNLIRALAGR